MTRVLMVYFSLWEIAWDIPARTVIALDVSVAFLSSLNGSNLIIESMAAGWSVEKNCGAVGIGS